MEDSEGLTDLGDLEMKMVKIKVLVRNKSILTSTINSLELTRKLLLNKLERHSEEKPER